VTEICQKENS